MIVTTVFFSDRLKCCVGVLMIGLAIQQCWNNNELFFKENTQTNRSLALSNKIGLHILLEYCGFHQSSNIETVK